MTKITFVSSSDHNYFPMLLEWVHAIRRFPQSAEMDICVLDAGMTPEQAQKIAGRVTHLVKPDWPRKIPPGRIKGREYYKACVCRPFLPDYFPGYDIYIWMDADTWVQDWRAVALLIQGAQRSSFAISPQVDRSYGKEMRLKWLGPLPFKPRSFYYSNAKLAFGGAVARALFPYPALNAGVFSLSADAPHWARWQDLLIKALDKGKVFTAEQLTLGMLVYLEGFSVERLPAYCNWLCEYKPLWDSARGIFVEPNLPHDPIGVVHLSGLNRMRVDRSVTEKFHTLEGGEIVYSYRYPYYDGAREVEISALP